MKKAVLLSFTVIALLIAFLPIKASSMDLLLNYQGNLSDNSGNPVADGNYQIIFSLWDDVSMGTTVWAETLTVAVSDGLFSVVLGEIQPPEPVIFNNQLYLQLQVGADSPIAPRTVMTATPYSAMAMSVPGFTPGPDNVISGAYAFAAGNGNTILSDFGSITGGQNNHVENLNNMTPDFDTVGIFDGGTPNSPYTSFDKSLVCGIGGGWIGGGVLNFATGNLAAVGAGSDNQSIGGFSAILGGCQNRARGGYDAIGGGYNNQTFMNGGWQTIGGGYNNNITSSWMSTIGGGYSNNIDVPTVAGTVGGGFGNRIQNHVGTIAGGYVNRTFDFGGTVGGGQQNWAMARYTTVSGGISNIANLNYATVGGGYGNNASGLMATIGGGGRADLADPLSSNEVYDNYGTIGGGGRNKGGSNDGIEINDQYTTISGGYFNQTLTGYSTIGGGGTNTTAGIYATVSGGLDNYSSNFASNIGGGQSNEALGYVSVVGGGLFNLLIADSAVIGGGSRNVSDGVSSVIGGGHFNNITNAGLFSTVGGGTGNLVQASQATIAGGGRNTITNIGTGGAIGGGTGNIAGNMATVPGGIDNEATGDNSFAAGTTAKATHSCSFVWSDCCIDATGAAIPLYSTGANTYNARATGGFYFFTDCDSLWDPTTPPSGSYLPPGGSMWLNGSDKNLKRNVREVNKADILDKVSLLPIYQWSYKTQDASIEHIGPMAQDFYKIFQIGDNNTSIGALDPAGVSLAAIKQLHEENQLLKEEIASLKKQVGENSELSDKVARLTEMVDLLMASKESKGSDDLAIK